MRILIIVIAVLFALSRIWIGVTMESNLQPEDIYKDMAHLFVGGLAVLWWQSIHPKRLQNHTAVKKNKEDRRYFGWMFWGLVVIELVVALTPRVIGWFA